MKTAQRDELLSRLEERSCNIWRVVERLEDSQIKQNGLIQDNIKKTTRNSTWLVALRWIVSISLPIIVLLVTHLYGLW